MKAIRAECAECSARFLVLLRLALRYVGEWAGADGVKRARTPLDSALLRITPE